MQNPPRLTIWTVCHLVIGLSFLLVSVAGLWFPLAGRMRNFFAGILDQWPILRCLRLAGHHRQATQLLSLGNDAPHVISYGCKKSG